MTDVNPVPANDVDLTPEVWRPREVTMPTAGEWALLTQHARVIAQSGLVPRAVMSPPRDAESKILVILLKGRELGMPPMQALSHIHVIEGKPTLSAEVMRALIRKRGHKIRMLESTDTRCIVEGVRRDDPSHRQRVTWTIDMARTAGLTGKDNWKKYPQSMLAARATAQLARLVFDDVLMGASYTPEEMGATVGPDGQVIDIEPVIPVISELIRSNRLEHLRELLEARPDRDELTAKILNHYGVQAFEGLTAAHGEAIIRRLESLSVAMGPEDATEVGLRPSDWPKLKDIGLNGPDGSEGQAKRRALVGCVRGGPPASTKTLTPSQREVFLDAIDALNGNVHGPTVRVSLDGDVPQLLTADGELIEFAELLARHERWRELADTGR